MVLLKENILVDVDIYNNSEGSFIPNKPDNTFAYEIIDNNNKITYTGNILKNSDIITNNNLDPLLTLEGNNCKISTRYCYTIKLKNLLSFTNYKLRIKYNVSKYKYNSNEYESVFSEYIDIKSKCLLSNDICKKKCFDENQQLVDCGPTNNDPFVPDNRQEYGTSWPFYKKLISNFSKCECKQLDINEKKILCQELSDNNVDNNFTFNTEDNLCYRVLSLRDCLNDRIGLDPVHDQFYEKLPKAPKNIICSLPSEENLIRECEKNDGMYYNKLCYPPLISPIIYDTVVDINTILYKFKIRFNLDDYKIIYKLNGVEREIYPTEQDGVIKLTGADCDFCNIQK